jgi:solute carrier family 25 oxoglutarate transporter 11
MPYKNLIDCMAKEIANNGPKGLYVGLPTFVTRIAPHAMIVLLISDQLKKYLH